MMSLFYSEIIHLGIIISMKQMFMEWILMQFKKQKMALMSLEWKLELIK